MAQHVGRPEIASRFYRAGKCERTPTLLRTLAPKMHQSSVTCAGARTPGPTTSCDEGLATDGQRATLGLDDARGALRIIAQMVPMDGIRAINPRTSECPSSFAVSGI